MDSDCPSPPEDLSLRALIDRAWRERLQDNLEECLTLLPVIRARIKLAYIDGKIELSNLKPNHLSIDGLLFLSSMARANSGFTESKNLISQAEVFLIKHNLPPHPRLYLERGLKLFYEGNFNDALSDFLMADQYSDQISVRIHANLNALLCMENLQLPRQIRLTKIRKLLKVAKVDSKINSQLIAYQQRESLRRGRYFNNKENRNGRSKNQIIDQPRFFELWTSQLPYLSSYHELNSKDFEPFANANYFLQKSYRLRTLNGGMHPNDIMKFKYTDFSDRLYLWVWKWLTHEKCYLSKVIEMIKSVKWADMIPNLTIDDKNQLLISLNWIGLFDPASRSRIAELTSKIGPLQTEGFPVFDLEYLIINIFRSYSEKSDWKAKEYEKLAKAHPLWNSNFVKLRELLISGGRSPKLRSLYTDLEKFKENRDFSVDSSISSSKISVLVDMDYFLIKNRKSGSEIHSQSLSEAIKLLKKNNRVNCEEFVFCCFGYRRYDPMIHNGKIFNLLSRLKSFFGSVIKFSVKSNFIISNGDWESVLILENASQDFRLPHLHSWSENLRLDSESEKIPAESTVNTAFDKKMKTRFLKRSDLERILGKSRATTNRKIKEWEKNGHLQKVGNARGTTYRLTSELKDQLFLNGTVL